MGTLIGIVALLFICIILVFIIRVDIRERKIMKAKYELEKRSWERLGLSPPSFFIYENFHGLFKDRRDGEKV